MGHLSFETDCEEFTEYRSFITNEGEERIFVHKKVSRDGFLNVALRREEKLS